MNKYLFLLLFMFISVSCGKDVAPYSDLMTNQADDISISTHVESNVENIFIHCTATRGNWNKEKLLNFFRNIRGWSKPGYHYFIPTDGSIDTLVKLNDDSVLSWDEVAYGARGYNSVSIHVAYDGGVVLGIPKDTRTQAQKAAINKVIMELHCQFPDAKVRGHNEVNHGKACPSYTVGDEFMN